MTRSTRVIALCGATILTLTACGSPASESVSTESVRQSSGSHYPVTLENCGEDVVFDSSPERIALMETAPVTILDKLGLLDRVVVRAGEFPADYYGPDLNGAVEEIPSLSEDLDAAGHLALSQEEIVAHQPDLVLGMPEGVTRNGLQDGAANVLEQEIYCPAFEADATFGQVFEEVLRYGDVFDRQQEARDLVSNLEERVEAAAGSSETEDRTAAVLYPSVGGGPLYAYGRGSMAHPQLETLGFENVFTDSSERVFEVQSEELIGRDPDVLILLHQGDGEGVEEAVLEIPGADNLSAVQNDAVLTHLFNYTEPATPLSVEGLEMISHHFQDRD